MSSVKLPFPRFFGNLVALYGVQIASLVIPLVLLPYLARTLQPAAWGQLAAVQSLSGVLMLIVEYGFTLSATRSVAAARQDTQQHAATAAGVLGAKAVLSCLLLVVAIVVYALVSPMREEPGLYWWGVAYAVAQGFSPLWYFQGRERLRSAAALEVLARAFSVPLILVSVHAPDDAWRVLAVHAALSVCITIVNTVRMYREIAFRVPTRRETLISLREGWTLFLYRGAVTLYTTANAFILRLLVPAASVGLYVNAERLTSAGKGMLVPVSQLLFPHITNLVSEDRERARRVATLSLAGMTLLGAVGTITACLLAPVVVHVLFGPGYEQSVGLLRILALTLPLVGISSVLGIQWMLPLGLDRAFNTIIASAGFLNVALAILLTTYYGSTGMAWAVTTSEAYVAVAMLIYLARQGLAPIQFGRTTT